VLTPEGVQAALEIGSRLTGGYDLCVSQGAQRATQTIACFLAGLGQRVRQGVVGVLGLVGEIVKPISKGEGLLIVEEDGALRVEALG
jgi:broad specificity phosphatase PhoE